MVNGDMVDGEETGRDGGGGADTATGKIKTYDRSNNTFLDDLMRIRSPVHGVQSHP
jgi:hypothetical protein